MKYFFRFLIIAVGLGIVVFYSSDSAPKPLEGPEIDIKEAEDVEDLTFNNVSLQRPTSGISTYIGKPVENVVKQFEQPHRIEMTPYAYDWWIYNQYELYIMFGVQDGIVKQVYTNSTAYDVSPYIMYMTADDIFRMTIIDGEITAQIGENLYMYTMSNYDMKYRILVRFEDVYAQLYIDANSDKLTGIRYMDGETLVAHKPYEMQYLGELIEEQPMLFTERINRSNAQLLFELTNTFRLKEQLPALTFSNQLSQVAQGYSEELFAAHYDESSELTASTAKDRLDALQITYREVGENIATGYYDAIEAIHGFMNSSKHRKLIDDAKFTDIGVGATETYYAQILLEREEETE